MDFYTNIHVRVTGALQLQLSLGYRFPFNYSTRGRAVRKHTAEAALERRQPVSWGGGGGGRGPARGALFAGSV